MPKAKYINFEVGKPFPLPILAHGEGALFQADRNGLMFILRLSRADVVAVEAFRTGAMRFALTEEDGVPFFLYQIDGIFKAGWGDAPIALATLSEKALPDLAHLEAVLHLYLVDPTTGILLALRRIALDDAFMAALKACLQTSLERDENLVSFQERLARVYANFSPADLADKAMARQDVPLALSKKA